MKTNFLLIVSIIFISVCNNLLAEKVYTLCYHTFLDKPDVGSDFSIDEMKKQIKTLKDANMKFVTLEDVLNGNITGNNNILITIDDGHRTVYELYNAVLKPNGIKPALAIFPNAISRSKNYMTWAQLETMVKDGSSIMSHGYFSQYLNDKLASTNYTIFKQEIVRSKNVLEEKLGIKVDTLAYPFGIYSDSAIKLIKETGYKAAFTIEWGATLIPINKNKDIYMLPRYMVTKKTQKNQFNAIISDSKK